MLAQAQDGCLCQFWRVVMHNRHRFLRRDGLLLFFRPFVVLEESVLIVVPEILHRTLCHAATHFVGPLLGGLGDIVADDRTAWVIRRSTEVALAFHPDGILIGAGIVWAVWISHELHVLQATAYNRFHMLILCDVVILHMEVGRQWLLEPLGHRSPIVLHQPIVAVALPVDHHAVAPVAITQQVGQRLFAIDDQLLVKVEERHPVIIATILTINGIVSGEMTVALVSVVNDGHHAFVDVVLKHLLEMLLALAVVVSDKDVREAHLQMMLHELASVLVFLSANRHQSRLDFLFLCFLCHSSLCFVLLCCAAC